MKKIYIRPTIKFVKISSEHHLAAGSPRIVTKEGTSAFSRESSIWDDEDEEIENSMWK